ncbi:MAG TPA: copper-translocating P-type ATPase [Ignavibacteria bacterium]|nr:copper-translocating P-type ATPase [Ignavibacteria bacterium]
MHNRHEGHSIDDFKKRFFICLIATIPVLLLSHMIQHWLGLGESLKFTGDLYVLFLLSSFIYFYGGAPFLKGFIHEIKGKQPGMMTLIAIAISVAYIYSALVIFGFDGSILFWELATLIDIMLLGHWIEMKSVLGASKALEELAKLMPSDAHKINPDGSIIDIALSKLKIDDKVLIKPGEKIPADGIVIKGITSVNESMLTGESMPVSKSDGANVIGGSINGEGSITIEVKKTGEDSFLSQVIELVKQAQESKSKTQDLANKAALWLTIVAIIGGALTFFVWVAFSTQSFAFAMERTVTVMVIACPHALGLAVPLVVAISTAIGAQHGLLIRDRIAFEKSRNIQAIVFDKTGTLTEGKFGITNIILLSKNFNEEELIKLAGSIESYSEHPIAKGIADASKDKYAVNNFKAIVGKGAEGVVNGDLIKIVSPGFLKENNISYDNEEITKLFEEGKTVVFVLKENIIIGAIALADIIRKESKLAIEELKKMGIKSIMLTGDNKKVAEWVAREIGLDEYFAEVLPQDKVNKIKEVQERGLTVAMTGDGVNDAPALAQADIGIAIGAGTDVAIEAADIILIKSNPLDVVSIIKLSHATYNKMVQNLLWATGYNIFAIPLAAGVLFSFGILLNPAVGAVLMSLSTVIVAINAKFLKI